jgi:hypothetical protein
VRINKNKLEYTHSLRRDYRLNVTEAMKSTNFDRSLSNGVYMDAPSKSMAEMTNGNALNMLPFDNLVHQRVAKSPR